MPDPRDRDDNTPPPPGKDLPHGTDDDTTEEILASLEDGEEDAPANLADEEISGAFPMHDLPPTAVAHAAAPGSLPDAPSDPTGTPAEGGDDGDDDDLPDGPTLASGAAPIPEAWRTHAEPFDRQEDAPTPSPSPPTEAGSTFQQAGNPMPDTAPGGDMGWMATLALGIALTVALVNATSRDDLPADTPTKASAEHASSHAEASSSAPGAQPPTGHVEHEPTPSVEAQHPTPAPTTPAVAPPPPADTPDAPTGSGSEPDPSPQNTRRPEPEPEPQATRRPKPKPRPEPSRTASTTDDPPKDPGPRSRADLQRTLAASYPLMRCTHRAEASGTTVPPGSVWAQVTVLPDGSTRDFVMASPAWQGTDLAACLENTISGLSFPPGESTETLRFTAPR